MFPHLIIFQSTLEENFSLACLQVDVSGAYESLPHSKLMEVVSEALLPFMDEPCTIRRYARIWAEAHEGLKRVFVRQVR